MIYVLLASGVIVLSPFMIAIVSIFFREFVFIHQQ